MNTGNKPKSKGLQFTSEARTHDGNSKENTGNKRKAPKIPLRETTETTQTRKKHKESKAERGV
ncbi:hypothetical protein BPOR_0175g00130 [Botrytis porri]|uniref:Uncharacterized protein n=1 Tax=Botrytis porri TaxID=87229 RepID=A0A4Z1KUN6_9HELO|nr:hypothetical protein BPOR_0175g00130 [Botrytis porri]